MCKTANFALQKLDNAQQLVPVAIITRLLSLDRLYLHMREKSTSFAYKLHGTLIFRQFVYTALSTI